MIKSFSHKGLKEVWDTGRSAKVRQDLIRRIVVRLDALDAATDLSQLDQPGFEFHVLHGKPTRHTLHVNGPFCLTFEWIDGDVWRVDLVQYH